MKDVTQEDINRSIMQTTKPVKDAIVEKGASIIGKAKPDPSLVTRLFTKLFKFIWSLVCFPFLPVINMWRKA